MTRNRAVAINRPDTVFRVWSGRFTGKRPESLAAWRVTTDSRKVAERIVCLFGGVLLENAVIAEGALEVLTKTDSMRIIVDGLSAIRSSYVLHGWGGLIHECDGTRFVSPSKRVGKLCGCPESFAEKMALARTGHGPIPDSSITFRLAESISLGEGLLTGSSWDLARAAHLAREVIDGQVLCDLSLELVKGGTVEGEVIAYRKPVINVLGPCRAN